MYPNGAQGGRAWLYTGLKDNVAYPFPTWGEHYVYAEAGEYISFASSYQGYGNSTTARIKLFDPNGVQIALTIPTSADGKIADRTHELGGPALPGQAPTGNEYKGIYHQVTVSGIYRIYFHTNKTATSDYVTTKGNYAADEDWVQNTNSSVIAAWDVSVANASASAWITGRLFTYTVNMSINSGSTNPYKGGFYGNFKILTGDGYIYNVNTNGNNGIQFTFTVNNKGFFDPSTPNISSYQSLNATGKSGAWIRDRYHDP